METERWEKAQAAEKKFWKEHSYETPSFAEDLQLLKKHNINTENMKVLEIGGGATGIVNVLKGERYAVDPLMDFFLDKYQLPKGIQHLKGKGEDLPFKDKFFDIVFCLNTLDHADKPMLILNESNRCLKDGGIFFMTLNCYDKQIVAVRRFSEKIGAGDICHPYTYTSDEIKQSLTDAGFELTEMLWDEELDKRISESDDPQRPFFERLTSVIKLRGFGYIIKRALILPLHFIVNRRYKSYTRIFFVCRKKENKLS
jgi:SAM-dependent methyltransferase